MRARATRFLAILATLLLAGAVIAACGGDDDGGGGGGVRSKPGIEGAEGTVKEYLRALSKGDGDAACALLTEEYRKEIVERNEAGAKQLGASNCEEFITKLIERSKSVTFEGEPLTEDKVDSLDLKTQLRGAGSDNESATVTGARGQQKYELERAGGEWTITGIQ